MSVLHQELISYRVLVLLVVGAMLFIKAIRLRRFRWDRDEIWQPRHDCSSSKYQSIDGVGF